MTQTLELLSTDGRFGLRVLSGPLVALLKLSHDALPCETGGILVGHYGEGLDWAYVTKVSAAPRDSRAGRYTFERGVQGLERWLKRLWKAPRRAYYLGEWHFHPHGSASASAHDRAQMTAISRSPAYRCPEPVLLILGGDPRSSLRASAYMFPSGGHAVPLRRAPSG